MPGVSAPGGKIPWESLRGDKLKAAVNVLPNSSASSTGGAVPSAQAKEGNSGVGPLPVAGRFPPGSRLRKHADFDRVYKEGKKHFAPHLTVFYRQRSGSDRARVGFAVGRALGGAVDRNRIKRRLREATRVLLPALPNSLDVVINPRKSALTAEFSQLRDAIAQAFAKIARLCNRPTGAWGSSDQGVQGKERP